MFETFGRSDIRFDGRTVDGSRDGFDADATWAVELSPTLGSNWRVAHSGPRVGRIASSREHRLEGVSEPTLRSESAHARARSFIPRSSAFASRSPGTRPIRWRRIPPSSRR